MVVPLLPLLLCLLLAGADAGKSNLTLSIDTPLSYPTIHPKLNATHTIKLGSVGILGLNMVSFRVAVEYVNNNLTLLPDVAIELYGSTTVTAASDNDVLFQTLYHVTSLGVNGLLGPTTTTQSMVMQQIAKLYTVPQVGSIALSNSLADKTLYPTFLRTLSSDKSQIHGIIAFFQLCGWTKGVVVYSNNDYGLGFSDLVLQASEVNITLTPVAASISGTTADYYAPVAETVKSLSSSYHIFVLYTSGITGNLMQALANAGLNQIGNVFIITGDVANAARANGQYRYLDSMFGFGSGLPSGPDYEAIMAFWKTRNITQYSGISLNPYYCIDSVLSYVYAYDRLLNSGMPFDAINGTILLGELMNHSYPGVTGEVVIDSVGNRLGQFEIYNYYNFSNPDNSTFSHVASYSVVTQEFVQLADFYFPGFAAGVIPPDGPYTCAVCLHGTCVENVGCVCNEGYSGISCDVKNKGDTVIIPWLVPLLVVIVASAIGVYFFYKKKRSQLVRQVAEKQRSIILRSDLTLLFRIGRGASGEVWKGTYRGTDVAVKKIITSHVDKQVIENFELEVAIMCGLRHPNIILFMGSCFDEAANEMLLVMEYMARGSLNDIIHDHNIPLSYEMKLHLACQAAQGMNFLHQSVPPTLHLDLKSHNILLDDKWNARISDFGIAKFKEESKTARNANTGQSIGTIYWSSPEALEGNGPLTEKCDCYSFGIVLWELFHRQMPYKGRDPVSVALDVIHNNLRPALSSELPVEIQDLIKACWAKEPKARPSFQEIMTTLRTLSMTTPLHAQSVARVEAPTGQVFLVSTDILGAYSLWEDIPRDMEQSMKLHNQLIRNNINLYNGYEVSFVHHSFTAAFSTMDDAVNFCIAVQISLLRIEWPDKLLAEYICAPVYEDGGNLLWKGLRVKMSICSGVPNCNVDPSSGRMTYFGPVVEKLERMLAMSHEGSLLIDGGVADLLDKKHPALIQAVSTRKIGDVKGSARSKKEDVYQLMISSLSGRYSKHTPGNDAIMEEPNLPHVVVPIDNHMLDDEELETIVASSHDRPLSARAQEQANKSVTWLASNSDIEIKETIGKGPIGDYFTGNWKGKEVAVKVLVNQKLKEDDLFKLIGDSAYMSKLNNPNLLRFYAICVEPNHLTIISEYVPKGNLRLLLNNTSVQLPLARKVKIALSLAQGMSYLTSLPDTAMQMHDNLKSNNVLVTKDWEVKVADYGHSNIRELARTMTSVGNIAWTAPEILNGQEATPRVATYSFGIILIEIYTRQVPYASEHPIRVVTKILNGYRPPLPADCPPAYKQLVDQCVEAEPENRPTWEAIINSLSDISKTV